MECKKIAKGADSAKYPLPFVLRGRFQNMREICRYF